MAKIEPFDQFTERYEQWFERHLEVYLSEINAIRSLIPKSERGVEIGVGTGRFAAPLGIKLGVEPSAKMGEIAKERGIEVISGVAENLPIEDEQFDFVLMVTTICFVDDAQKALGEACRVLKKDGHLLIGFIDKNSPLGRIYQEEKEQNPFYKVASFFSARDLEAELEKAGFRDFRFVQTIFHPLNKCEAIELTKEGYGEGSFVVVSAGR